jgi:hypothetical protein
LIFNLELREQGYIVDLNETTLNQVKNFRLTYNRHDGKYDYSKTNYNYAIYNTRNYYTDQNHHIFQGDVNYYHKIWKLRSRTKSYLAAFILFVMFLNTRFPSALRRHQEARAYNQKMMELDKNE